MAVLYLSLHELVDDVPLPAGRRAELVVDLVVQQGLDVTGLLYRVTSYTWPCISGTLYKVTCPVYACRVSYTGQVTFYKVQKKHSHVYLVRLNYIITLVIIECNHIRITNIYMYGLNFINSNEPTV